MIAFLIFLLILSVLVVGHEFGHFLAARICGVKAEEFGYGFPPRAIGFVKVKNKWKKVGADDQNDYQNTVWSLNWLPLGGFVRLKGESGDGTQSADSFASKNVLRRLFILFAGVAMNWLMAAAIIIAGFMIGVPAQTDGLPKNAIVRDQHVQIVDVYAGSAADHTGIQPGDLILSIDGQTLDKMIPAQDTIARDAAAGQPITLRLQRDQQILTLTTKAAYIEELKRPGLGIALADTGIVRFPWFSAIGQGLAATGEYTKYILVGFWQLIQDLILHQSLSAGVAGPVGIAVITGKVAQQGFWPLMQFAALLSLNLAIVNVLPIPALDGGRIFFILVEWIRRRKMKQSLEAAIHRIGFAVLLFLILIVTLHDVLPYGAALWRFLSRG